MIGMEIHMAILWVLSMLSCMWITKIRQGLGLHLTACEVAGVKVKVKITLEQATKFQRGSRGIALLFL